jgi:hypothetical protein
MPNNVLPPVSAAHHRPLTRPGAVIAPPKGRVRPLEREDLSQIVALHVRVFGRQATAPPDRLQSYLSRVLYEHPWIDGDCPSLVYEDRVGRVVGCLGVMPRPMIIGGRPGRAAIAHHYLVDPTYRAARAGVELVRRFLAGPQDFSLTEGNERTRQIWQAFGGGAVLLRSLHWTRPLRPSSYLLSLLSRRGLPRPMATTLAPVCRGLDAITPAAAPRAFRPELADVHGTEIDASALRGCLTMCTADLHVQPFYDLRALEWLLETLSDRPHHGTLHRVAVRDGAQRVLGWYLYYLGANGHGDVVQVGGYEHGLSRVLDHLFCHARQHGAVSVSGALEPHTFSMLARKSCAFHFPDSSWVLVHGRDAGLVNAIHHGNAFLTRLEGEWWLGN